MPARPPGAAAVAAAAAAAAASRPRRCRPLLHCREGLVQQQPHRQQQQDAAQEEAGQRGADAHPYRHCQRRPVRLLLWGSAPERTRSRQPGTRIQALRQIEWLRGLLLLAAGSHNRRCAAAGPQVQAQEMQAGVQEELPGRQGTRLLPHVLPSAWTVCVLGLIAGLVMRALPAAAADCGSRLCSETIVSPAAALEPVPCRPAGCCASAGGQQTYARSRGAPMLPRQPGQLLLPTLLSCCTCRSAACAMRRCSAAPELYHRTTHLSQVGKLCIEVTPNDKIAWISEDLCIGCGICVKARPMHGCCKLVTLSCMVVVLLLRLAGWRAQGCASSAASAPGHGYVLLLPCCNAAMLPLLQCCRCCNAAAAICAAAQPQPLPQPLAAASTGVGRSVAQRIVCPCWLAVSQK